MRATYEIQSQVGERRRGGEELIEEAERLIFALRGADVLAKQRLLEDAITEELERLEQAAKDKRDLPDCRQESRIWTGCSVAGKTRGCTWWLPARRWAKACWRCRSHVM